MSDAESVGTNDSRVNPDFEKSALCIWQHSPNVVHDFQEFDHDSDSLASESESESEEESDGSSSEGDHDGIDTVSLN